MESGRRGAIFSDHSIKHKTMHHIKNSFYSASGCRCFYAYDNRLKLSICCVIDANRFRMIAALAWHQAGEKRPNDAGIPSKIGESDQMKIQKYILGRTKKNPALWRGGGCRMLKYLTFISVMLESI